jgi:hypothetical protein
MSPEERQLLDTFLTVELEIDEKTIRQRLLPQLTMAEKNIPDVINDHMDELPARLAFWGALFAKLVEIHSEAEDELELWLARKRQSAELALEAKDKKVTKDSVLSEILSDEDDFEYYQEAKKRVRVAKRFKEMAWRFCDAFEARGNMLQSIGANLRGERERAGGIYTPDKSRRQNGEDEEFAAARR